MDKEKKIVKFRTRREVNIGIVIASGLLLLMIVQIYRYFTNPHLSVYEVKEGSAGGEVTLDAMILRDEQVFLTSQAGYLNFYFREGKRAQKGAKIYSVNDSENLKDFLNLKEEDSVLSKNDLSHLKTDIREFSASFHEEAFSETQKLHETFLSDYLRYQDISLSESLTETSSGSRFTDVLTDKSGTVTFFSDCYDEYTLEKLQGDEFLKEKKAIPEISRKKGIVGKDCFAYKLILSENWQLVFPVEKDILQNLSEKKVISFSINENNTTFTKPFTLFDKAGKSFVSIQMNRYICDFLSVRYVTLKIKVDEQKGLKIPKSAVLEKELYQIPERFVSKGGGEDSLGLNIEAFEAKSGEVRPDFRKLTPLFYEDGYYFFSADVLDSGLYLYSVDLQKEPERVLLYSFLTKLEGVYNMNKGYAVFRRITRITDIDNYILVKEALPGGVALYDHIVLDTKAVTKDVILVEGDN